MELKDSKFSDSKMLAFRPTFYFNDEKTYPIRAGGVLIYKIINNRVKLLMIKKKDETYEDIGGKTDLNDITELDTICREVEEETNMVINKNIIKYQLNKSKNIYITNSKYLLYLVEANSYERNLKSTYFGTKELKDNIIRTIQWIDIDNLLENKLKFNPRICGSELKIFLKDHFNL